MRARENPFRVERLHSLSFRPRGTDWATLIDRLESLNHRAAIVGPCGSGKTTLLHELAAHLEREGRRVTTIFMNDTSPPPGRCTLQRAVSLGAQDVILFDGAGHLARWAWWRFRRQTRRAGGLIVTAHEPGLLPTLLTTRTEPALLEELLAELSPDHDAAQRPGAAELFHRHHGNVREALRELYDWHASQTAGS
jgi:hypothetical protein